MAAPKNSRTPKRNETAAREQIYCRMHNRLYSNCPVENELHLCECLSQCEVALRNNGYGALRKTG
jgi:hypothetical protein